jgi:hypothetical protein
MENQSTDIHQASQPPTGSLGTGVSQGHKVHGTITIFMRMLCMRRELRPDH